MSIPTLTTCDLFTKNGAQTNLVVHCLDDLLAEDIYIPKKPHRHTFYQVVFIQQGSGLHKIDFHDYKISDNSLFFLAPGQAHNLELKKHSKGVLINFDESLYHTFLADANAIDKYPFFNRNGKNSLYQLTHNDTVIFDVIERIKFHRSNTKLIRLYLLELFHFVHQNHKETSPKAYTASQKLMVDFDVLIEQNYDLQHYPKFYANELSVTPNHLNSVCQKTRSKTAGDVIRERVVLETKRLLVNSQLTVTEIAYLLGFDDNSYFTKFFKQQEGLTPTQFRKKL